MLRQHSKKLVLVAIFGSCVLVFGALDFFGIIWHNDLFAYQYPVKGLDVSHHQGIIDWHKVAETHHFQFVYIKATEGHDFVDDSFLPNWTQAKQSGFLVGAYHFFSLRSSGKEQAELFIATVPREPHTLPPVVDVEVNLSTDPRKVQQELQTLLTQLESYYHQKPILYVTYDTYDMYVKGNFSGYPLWIRDVFKFPSLGNTKWLIWQYGNRGRVNGIPAFVDVNAFQGNAAQLQALTQYNKPKTE